MIDILNFHDTWVVAQGNWVWLAVSLGLGIWFGWATAADDQKDESGRQ